jgi:hypothetical protein
LFMHSKSGPAFAIDLIMIVLWFFWHVLQTSVNIVNIRCVFWGHYLRILDASSFQRFSKHI